MCIRDSPNPHTGGDSSPTHWGGSNNSGDVSQAYWGKGGKAGAPGFHRATSRSWEPFGHSTLKVPPFWEPTLELRGYTFRVWLQGLDVWAAGTELNQELIAPAVVQRFGGAARELVRAVPAQELRDGRFNPATQGVDTGLQILARGLERRFGAFAVETSTRVIIDLLQFRRRGTESIDEAPVSYTHPEPTRPY